MMGKIVSFKDGSYAAYYGKVVAVKEHWRHTPQEQFYARKTSTPFDFRIRGESDQRLFHVHYIDPRTGLLMVCPDARPHTNIFSCPICGKNSRIEEIEEFSQRDLHWYLKNNMINSSILGG